MSVYSVTTLQNASKYGYLGKSETAALLKGLTLSDNQLKLETARQKINAPYDNLIGAIKDEVELKALSKKNPKGYKKTSKMNRQLIESFDEKERVIAHKVLRVVALLGMKARDITRDYYMKYRDHLLRSAYRELEYMRDSKIPKNWKDGKFLTPEEMIRILKR